MSSVTDAIKDNIPITEYAQRLGYHVVQVSAHRFSLQEHDSMAITVDETGREVFKWNSRDVGGSVIDFAMAVQSIDKEAAIKQLREMLDGRTPQQVQQAKQYRADRAKQRAAPKQLAAPPPAPEGGYRKVYAYLVKSRGIEQSIVSQLMKEKQLYQDERGNAVFLGKDYDGTDKYAFKRSTNTSVSYRGEAPGSDKEVGFSVGLVDRQPRRLFVAEAAIDALSLKSLMLVHGCNDADCAYLACGGTSSKALLYHLAKHPQLQTIYLCHDNDEAGNQARTSLRAELQKQGFAGKVIDKVPVGKDFNQDLQTLRAAAAPQQMQFHTVKERGMTHEITR